MWAVTFLEFYKLCGRPAFGRTTPWRITTAVIPSRRSGRTRDWWFSPRRCSPSSEASPHLLPFTRSGSLLEAPFPPFPFAQIVGSRRSPPGLGFVHSTTSLLPPDSGFAPLAPGLGSDHSTTSHLRAFMYDFMLKGISDSGGAVWGDRARVRIYSDPFLVAAPPDFSDTSFSPFRTSSCLSPITLGLAGRIGTILPNLPPVRR